MSICGSKKGKLIVDLRKLRSYAVLAVLVALAFNCSAKEKEQPTQDPKFLAIDKIILLPLVDARADKTQKINLSTGLSPCIFQALARLRGRKYKVAVADLDKGVDEPTLAALQEANPEFIKRLGPPTARWVAVFLVSDSSAQKTKYSGAHGAAEVYGFLFDKETGTVLWKGSSAGAAVENADMRLGPVGYLIGQGLVSKDTKSAVNEAIENALDTMILTIPKRK